MLFIPGELLLILSAGHLLTPLLQASQPPRSSDLGDSAAVYLTAA